MKMVYNSKSAFDAWEKLGNPGWNWHTMLPYLQRFHTHHEHGESFQEIVDIATEPVQSAEGPIQTSYGDASDIDKAVSSVLITTYTRLRSHPKLGW